MSFQDPGGYGGLVNDLGGERYVSLTSFRDGRPVATPVWVIAHDGHLYVWTGARTGKVRRIRHNPDVTLAACTARGTVTGAPRRAHARIVPASERPEVWNTFRAKYRVQLQAILLAERITKMVRRRSGQPGERVYLELTLATPERHSTELQSAQEGLIRKSAAIVPGSPKAQAAMH